MIGIPHSQVDFDPRELPVIGADDGGHEVGSDHRRGPHGNFTPLQGPEAAEERLDLLVQIEEPLRIGQQGLALPGQTDPFPGAVEEPAADLILQGADLLADGRLGQEELPRCLREAPCGGHFVEGLELVNIHKNPLWKRSREII
jgi:hypothetical protein